MNSGSKMEKPPGVKKRGAARREMGACERYRLGLAWLGLAWLGLAWLGKIIAPVDFLMYL
jgi:hypothetical protein